MNRMVYWKHTYDDMYVLCLLDGGCVIADIFKYKGPVWRWSVNLSKEKEFNGSHPTLEDAKAHIESELKPYYRFLSEKEMNLL